MGIEGANKLGDADVTTQPQAAQAAGLTRLAASSIPAQEYGGFSSDFGGLSKNEAATGGSDDAGAYSTEDLNADGLWDYTQSFVEKDYVYYVAADYDTYGMVEPGTAEFASALISTRTTTGAWPTGGSQTTDDTIDAALSQNILTNFESVDSSDWNNDTALYTGVAPVSVEWTLKGTEDTDGTASGGTEKEWTGSNLLLLSSANLTTPSFEEATLYNLDISDDAHAATQRIHVSYGVSELHALNDRFTNWAEDDNDTVVENLNNLLDELTADVIEALPSFDNQVFNFRKTKTKPLTDKILSIFTEDVGISQVSVTTSIETSTDAESASSSGGSY